jgi:spore germination protein KA
MKDVFVKVPWWAMFTRPRLLGSENHVRHGFGMRPKPPEEEMKS